MRVGFTAPRTPSGDHNRKETPVPIPNTVVKLSVPMIVPTSAKVGIASFFQKPRGDLPAGFLFLYAARTLSSYRHAPSAKLPSWEDRALGVSLDVERGCVRMGLPKGVEFCGASEKSFAKLPPHSDRPFCRVPYHDPAFPPARFFPPVFCWHLEPTAITLSWRGP